MNKLILLCGMSNSGMFWEFHPELSGEWKKDNLFMKKEIQKALKKLRQETGASLMDCKKGLNKFDYDYNKAKLWLVSEGHLKYTI